MKTAALSIAAVSLILGGSAFAAERVAPTTKQCEALASFLTPHMNDSFTPLTSEQFSLYVACNKAYGPRHRAYSPTALTTPVPAPHARTCETVAALKIALKGAKFTALNAGQFHLMEGAYIAVPPPSGLPPADGAVLVQIKDKSIVIWMSGSCASKENPMPISDRVVAALRTISPANGEIAEPDDSKDELHL